MLFLSKTFESVSSGELQLELEDGFHVISVMSTFEEELFDEFFSQVAELFSAEITLFYRNGHILIYGKTFTNF